MSPAILSMILVLAAPKEDPLVLVERLGGATYSEREQAAESLRKLGPQAIVALRAARSHKDPEVRLRAESLLSKIENGLLVDGTLVELDYRDVTIPALVASIGERSGIAVSLRNSETDRFWAENKVSLVSPEPLPFWEVIERLTKTAGLSQMGMFDQSGARREPQVMLGRLPGGAVSRPVWVSGPFRVTVSNVILTRTTTFGSRASVGVAPKPGAGASRPRYDSVVGEQLSVTLELAAEPRLSVQSRGTARFLVASDEFGRSLLPRNVQNFSSYSSGYQGIGGSTTFQFQALLARPDASAKRIKSLKGTLPVTVSTKRPEPLEIGLGGSRGKTFQSEDASITVEDISFDERTRRGSISLLIRERSTQELPPEHPAGLPVGFVNTRSPIQQQLEVLDGKNQPIPWFVSSSQVAGETRFTLTVMPTGEVRLPERLRYYSLLRGDSEAAFEFTEIPIATE